MGRKDSYEFDVFVSYAEADRPWVKRELLPRLDAAKLRTFIDFDEFQPGAVGIEEFERGVKSSRRTILLFSPNYLTYNLARLGDSLSRYLDPAGKDRRCIPVKIFRCDIPAHLNYLVSTDLTPENSEERHKEWDKLIKSLKEKWNRRSPSPRARAELKVEAGGQQAMQLDPPRPVVSSLRNAIEVFSREDVYPNECDEVRTYLVNQLANVDVGQNKLHLRYALGPKIEELIGLIEVFRDSYPNALLQDKNDILYGLRVISEELNKLELK